jgi:hypothetical protein
MCKFGARRVFVCLLLLGIALQALAVAASRARPDRLLDDNWQLLPDTAERFDARALPEIGWRAVRVPLGIQVQFPDLRDFEGVAWYRRALNVSRLPRHGHLLLHFGAVDYLATLYVNGVFAGTHEDGYTPFDVDISRLVQRGRNLLLLKVTDPPGPPADWRASYAQIPHGKQNWYVQTTGIWQDVVLERRPASFISAVHALTSGNRLTGFEVKVNHPNALNRGAQAHVSVYAPDGTQTEHVEPLGSLNPAQESEWILLPFAMTGAELWSPEHPALYRYQISLPDGDVATGRFGFRAIETRDGRIYLNGQPFYMRAALDQDFYPDTGYTPPSKQAIVDEMRKARALGLNALRCHIKIPDPAYLDAADETGVLVWYELPNWDRLTPLSRQRAQQTLEAMIERDWNHPAIVIQSIINESWGIDLTQAADREWLRRTVDWARQHVPDRLIEDNSPCCRNFHLNGDLADFHQYYSMPDHQKEWDHWVAEYASRPAWLYSPYGDAVNDRQPLLVSEFGNWGLPQLPAAPDRTPQLPWWFDRSFGNNRVTRPGGVFERMSMYGLNPVFGNYEGLVRATQQQEWFSLRHEITSIREQPAIQGYVITDFVDIQWESNGLLTMWREPKNFASALAALQQPVVVLTSLDRPSYAPGETAHVALQVSNESPAMISAAVAVGDGHDFGPGNQVGAVAAGSVSSPVSAELEIPAEAAGYMKLAVRATDGDQTLNQRELLVPVVPQLEPHAMAIEVSDRTPRLRQALMDRGYTVGHEGVLLTNKWDTDAEQAAAAGRRVLLLADSEDALPAESPIHLARRTGDLAGNWITNFNWFNTTGSAYGYLRPFGPLAGPESRLAVPRYIIDGVPPKQFENVLSGMFLGWVHDVKPYTIAARHGRGSVLVTTWRLADSYGKDAYSTSMLDHLLLYAGRAETFEPISGLELP